ncbi:MAG: hypothetical protein A2126_01105 [Candidatus Woykebacteria bacterium GWB1_45_5]|uniref:Uncharacterized protein n=1 Tax=Candidatus Woykebacteria bacterium GWB1_45_5 TaxID=1802592 RepID=A0A1G1W5T2_9BACT|nr:MAG: hypothetical protein A2126_01105 [Candidatus Woykebacteria bacterium GWB1_45_5]
MSKLVMLAFVLATAVLAACGGEGQEIGVERTPPTSIPQAAATVAAPTQEQKAELCSKSGVYDDFWGMLCWIYEGEPDIVLVIRNVTTPEDGRAARLDFEEWVKPRFGIDNLCDLNVHIVYPNSFYARMSPSDYYLSGCAEGEGP